MNAPRLAAGFTLATLLALVAPASAGTSLVVDASTGAVLSADNPTQAWHPASTTKMMTLYVALKAVREGRIGLETPIPASKRAASQPRVKVYIKAGQEVTLDNAIRIMMVKSANDIAYVIAEGVGGTVENFVRQMNAEAERLGMGDTHFTNPNGWHDPNQQTSARDLAVLAMALMREFGDYSDYWNTGAVQLGKQVLQNTNGLVGRYSGINGFKTGFVCASGFNVVATATRGGRTLIAVVMGALSGSERTVKAAQLLDDGFGKWGGIGGNVTSMASGNGGRAYSICDTLRRGGSALGDDVDSAGPITYAAPINSNNAEGTSDRFIMAVPQAAQTGAMLSRTPSGRITLGPRAPLMPVQVSFGRTPGSASAPLAANAVASPATTVARGTIEPGAPVAAGLVSGTGARTASRNGAIPSATTAFAPATDGASGPLRLQGAIQPGAATPTSLRPGAAAGIKAKPAPRGQQAGTAAAKLKPAAKPPAKPQAKPGAKDKTAAQSRTAPRPPARPAAQPDA